MIKLIMSILLVFSVEFPCEIPQFSCLTGQCINMSKVDDNEVDCDDASDEGKLLNEPVHEIFNNVVCATSQASDQPAHTQSDQSPY